MQKFELELPKIKGYPEVYHKIITALSGAGAQGIGEINYREGKFLTKEGQVRTATLDMDKLSRVCRTLVVIAISPGNLEWVHQFEEARGDFIASFPARWLEKKFGVQYEPTQLSEKRIEAIEDFNDECRPAAKKYGLVSIPPYFDLDYTFDGMAWHHQFDINALKNKDRLYLPPLSTKVAGRKLLSEVG